ncbi:uncharacterized protein [Spinacia oleracea]|uniref:Uncharacterized protein isoform X3 n=1 Tax=Spinacia oleracea TaxID=3562 RepID=A0ABM3RB19_SPIOL|nr:uncharacterized protein LOC110779704 isoform X3 [Spinacia oleracea]
MSGSRPTHMFSRIAERKFHEVVDKRGLEIPIQSWNSSFIKCFRKANNMSPFAKIKEILGRSRMNCRAKETNQQAQDILFEDDLGSLLQGQVENTNTIGASSSSSAPVKTKNLNLVPRGRNKCKKVAHLSTGKKLRVAFYEGRVVGDDGNEFTRYIGKIVRNPNLCPVRVHKWEDLDSDNVEHMWAVLQEMIKKTIQENPEMEVFDVIEECFGRRNKGYVAGYGGSVKPKDLRGPLPNRFDLEMKLKQAGKVNEVLLGRIEHVEAENRTFATRLNEVEAKFQVFCDNYLDGGYHFYWLPC